MKEYRLYIGDIQDFHRGGYSYCEAERGYMLVYAKEKPAGEFKAVNEEKARAFLSVGERQWLLYAKERASAEIIKENQIEFSETVDIFTNIFEKHLKALAESESPVG